MIAQEINALNKKSRKGSVKGADYSYDSIQACGSNKRAVENKRHKSTDNVVQIVLDNIETPQFK